MIDLSQLEGVSGITLFDLEHREGIFPPLRDDFQRDPGRDDDEPMQGTAESRSLRTKYQYRRAFSEMALLDSLAAPGFYFEKGVSYNFMTRGDVDALSYLKAIIRQQNIRTIIVSTWCVDMNDVLTMRKWIDDGRIGHLDLFLGEIYRTGRHGLEAADFKRVFEGYENVTVTVARNHSKLMAGRGDKFDFVVQTSANINTNPRIENACILIQDENPQEDMVEFYSAFFCTVKSLK